MPVNAPRTTTIGTMPCPLSGITVSTMNSRGKVSQASTNRCTTKSNVPLQQPDSRPKKRAIDQADGNGYQGPGAATTGLQPPQGARNDARIRRGHTTNGVPCCWRTCAVARPVAGSLPDPRGVQSEHVRRCHARPARPAAAGWWGPPGCRCRQVGLTRRACGGAGGHAQAPGRPSSPVGKARCDGSAPDVFALDHPGAGSLPLRHRRADPWVLTNPSAASKSLMPTGAPGVTPPRLPVGGAKFVRAHPRVSHGQGNRLSGITQVVSSE